MWEKCLELRLFENSNKKKRKLPLGFMPTLLLLATTYVTNSAMKEKDLEI